MFLNISFIEQQVEATLNNADSWYIVSSRYVECFNNLICFFNLPNKYWSPVFQWCNTTIGEFGYMLPIYDFGDIKLSMFNMTF